MSGPLTPPEMRGDRTSSPTSCVLTRKTGPILTAALPEHEKFTGWLSYVKVKDLTAATEQARKLGATVVREDVQVPNEGRFSWIVDPAGAQLGLWEPIAR